VYKPNSPAGQVKCNNVPKTFRKPQDVGQLAKGNCRPAEWTRVGSVDWTVDRTLLAFLCLGENVYLMNIY